LAETPSEGAALLSGVSGRLSAFRARGLFSEFSPRSVASGRSRSSKLRQHEQFAQLQPRNDSAAAEVGDVILVSAPDAFDQAVYTQSLDVAGHLARFEVWEFPFQICVTEARDDMLTAHDGEQDAAVVSAEEVEASVVSTGVALRARALWAGISHQGSALSSPLLALEGEPGSHVHSS